MLKDIHMTRVSLLRAGLVLATFMQLGCASRSQEQPSSVQKVVPDYTLDNTQTHDKFSRNQRPVIRVPSGSIVEAFTHEATGGQFDSGSTVESIAKLDFDKVHTLTGPVFVNGAKSGDILAVKLLEMEPADWGWMAVLPELGLLADEYADSMIFKVFDVDLENQQVVFSDDIRIPMRPFPGVMGVAPDTDELLNTTPPRANGGNLDNPYFTVGTTVYFPVQVDGALFSIGDTHAVQGLGEVSGTALEVPMRVVYQISVIKDRPSIDEVQYETDAYYATTGFAPTLDEATKKATRYMITHLVETYGLSREDAYMLCSLAGDLHIAEVVDLPNMLVTMHMSKSIFGPALKAVSTESAKQ